MVAPSFWTGNSARSLSAKTVSRRPLEFDRLEERVVLSVSAVGNPYEIASPPRGVQGDPVVVHADDGSFLAIWQTLPWTGSTELVAQRFTADDQAYGPTISIVEGLVEGFTADMDAAGNFAVVTWGVATPGTLWRFDASGNELGSPTTFLSSGAMDLDMNGEGDIVVSWGDGFSAHATYFAAGAVSGTDIILDATAQAGKAAIDDDGDFLVTWTHASTSWNNTYFKLFDDSGSAVTEARQFPVVYPGYVVHHDVAMDSAGNFAVTWNETGSAQLYVRRYNALGFGITPATPLDDFFWGGLDNPEITVSDIGDVAIEWHDHGGYHVLWKWDVDQSFQPEFLSPQLFANPASISINAAGDLLLASLDYARPGGATLQGIRLAAGSNQFSDPFRLDAPQILQDYGVFAPPSVAITNAGEVLTTFVGQPAYEFSSGPTPYVQRFNADGIALGYPTAVATDFSLPSFFNRIATDAEGNYIVLWHVGYSFDSTELWAQLFDASGTARGERFLIATNTQFSAVDIADDGSFVIAYGNGAGEIAVQFFTATGLPTPQAFSIPTVHGVLAIELARNADGDIAIGWIDSLNWMNDLYGQVWDAQTGELGERFQLNEVGFYVNPTQPAFGLGLNDAGEAIFAWEAGGQVFLRRVSANGQPLGQPQNIQEGPLTGQALPVLAMTAAGDFLLAWLDTWTNTIRVRHYDAAGYPKGPSVPVATVLQPFPTGLALAINEAGEAVLSWTTMDPQNPEQMVFVQRLQTSEDSPGIVIDPITSIAEGESLSLSASTAIIADFYAWDLNGDGIFEDAFGLTPTLEWHQLVNLGLDGRDNAYSVRVAAMNGTTVLEYSPAAELTIDNVAPVAYATTPYFGNRPNGGAGQAVRGQEAEIVLYADDPSFADWNAGFTFLIDWNGDGIFDETVLGVNAVSAHHVYEEVGIYTIGIVAVDQDGGVSELFQTQFKVTDWDLQRDLLEPSKTNLVWGGTPGGDAFAFLGNYVITQMLNYQFYLVQGVTFVGSITGKLIVYGQGGDDLLFADIYSRPLEFHGGAGNDILIGGTNGDTLFGGDGDDILFGGTLASDGNDYLYGDAGDDILVGHLGADWLRGGIGQDLLVAGSLNFGAALPTAIYAIQAEWLSGRPIETRVAYIRGVSPGPGNNAGYYLQPQSTVLDDNAIDTLLGEGDADWLLLGIFEDTEFEPDPLDLVTIIF